MKSWEIEKELKEEGRKEGIKEERKNTEAERKRADNAEKERAKAVEDRVRLEAELAKYKLRFGEIA